MQKIVFMGSSRDDIRAFPEAARRVVGRQLLRLQHGLEPINWKPMKVAGSGVREIRLKAGSQYRVIYVTHIGNAIYVLHAFRKKTQKTSASDIALAHKRLKQIGE